MIVSRGVTIGKGAVIKAGAVSTYKYPDRVIDVGVPDRVIKMRDGIDSQGAGVGIDKES